MFDTPYNADSVEWCPHEPNQNVFVCANYQLSNNETQKRIGCILLFSFTQVGLKLHQTINTSAVLDQKWCHNQISGASILGVVDANKQLSVYRLKIQTDCLQLELVTNYILQDDHDETLLLSLDWSTGKCVTDRPQIVCSNSNGNVHLFRLSENRLELIWSWHGHEYEAWIAAFYYWDTNIIFTGGDDSVLLKFDRRTGGGAVMKNRSHGAGVTSIHSNASKEFMLATGSYDCYIRLWDVRKMKTAVYDLKMPGTLWRLKWDPFVHTKLLAACMLDGVHVIDAETEPKIIGSFSEHKSIAYGADWCHLKTDRIIGTCSFYDNLLCVSRLNDH